MIAIIANPKAGAGLSMRKLREARRILWGRRYEYFVPRSREEFSQVCASLDPATCDGVIVLGGDGTQNLAIRELCQDSKGSLPMYPFPVGTANDLAAEMRTTSRWEDVEMLLQLRKIERIDLLRVNGIPFATVAGIGLGAQLTAELNDKRESSLLLKLGLRYMKAPIYSALSVKTILMQKRLDREYLIDSGSLRQKIRASALFICNQGKLGGNICVSKSEDNTDSRFSVLVATATSRIDLIRALAELQRGQIPEKFVSFSTSRLTIECSDQKPIRVFGDGEILVEAPRLSFELLPRRLALFTSRATEVVS